MAKKKRHHYIPRFYLKRFSADIDGKLIGLYNHKSDVFIEAASLRHQAYENFLYGEDDEVENALADLEAHIGKMFYYWTVEKDLYPPPSNSNGLKVLQRFLIYQIHRTPRMGKELTDGINDAFAKILERFEPQTYEKFKVGRIENDNIVLLALLNSIGKEHMLNYMECKFVVNLSELPLITSDAPVIMYNQLMEAAGQYVDATGLAVKGLQIFYPIHPRLLLCLFDPEIYECDKGSKNCTSTESVDDIHQLNALQYINSDAQLFFNDMFSKDYFELLKEEYGDYRKVDRSKNKALEIEGRKPMFIASEAPQIDLNLSFFKTVVDHKHYKNEQAPLRHSSFYHS